MDGRGRAKSKIAPEKVIDYQGVLSVVRGLCRPGQRAIVGIAGAPGAGKSTLANEISAALSGLAVVVPMDGFHLAQAELERLGLTGRKGAPESFDAGGYLALLRRLRNPEGEGIIYGPTFDRDLEEPIAGSIAIPPDVPLVITEGNYLLSDAPVWTNIRPLLDECVWIDCDPVERRERLVARHVQFGKSTDKARDFVEQSDELNAELVQRDRHRASLVVRPT